MRGVPALCLALLAVPAAAEVPCHVLTDLLGPDLVLDALTADGPDTCRAEGGQFGVAPGGLRFGPAEIRSPGLAALLSEGTAPAGLQLTVRGIRPLILVGDPVMDYLLEIQTRHGGIDLSLDLMWEAEARRLTVVEALADFPGESLVRLSATIEGIDLDSQASVFSSVGGAGLTTLSAEIVADRLFEAYLLLPLGSALLSAETDPASQVAALKARGQILLAEVPETILDPQSQEALATLIGDLPTPRGTLRLDLTAEPMLGMVRATPFALTGMPRTPEEFWPVLDGVILRAEWERAG